MSYGINVIQLVPLFCPIKFAFVKHQTFSKALDAFIQFYTALACFKSARWLKLITTMQEKMKIFTFFSHEI